MTVDELISRHSRYPLGRAHKHSKTAFRPKEFKAMLNKISQLKKRTLHADCYDDRAEDGDQVEQQGQTADHGLRNPHAVRDQRVGALKLIFQNFDERK